MPKKPQRLITRTRFRREMRLWLTLTYAGGIFGLVELGGPRRIVLAVGLCLMAALDAFLMPVISKRLPDGTEGPST
jgi:hypothetical protein